MATKWPTWILISVCLSMFFMEINAQEKFTLNTEDKRNISEPRVVRATIPPTTRKPKVSSTKIPYRERKCPPEPLHIPFLSLTCHTTKDCLIFDPKFVCCKNHCITGQLLPSNTSGNVKKKSPPRKTILEGEKLAKEDSTSNNVRICPNENIRLPIFSLPCRRNQDCALFGRNLLCCRDVCLQGVFPPKEEVNHTPAFFGLVDRQCAAQPLAELADVKECETDKDCNPRICCPEMNSNVRKSYCRTPVHNIERLPGVKRIQERLENIVSYMQCTPPPPRELFPKPCNNTLDCFPNLCCQESGKKFCRPPKKSLVALIASWTTRFGAAEATKKFIERITT